VCKSVDRIFSIWQERNVYPEELISELKANLQKREKEKEKEKEKVKEQPPPPGQFLNCRLQVSMLESSLVQRFLNFLMPETPNIMILLKGTLFLKRIKATSFLNKIRAVNRFKLSSINAHI